jgi:hypothetical protein
MKNPRGGKMKIIKKMAVSFCLIVFLGSGFLLFGQTKAIRGAEIHTMAGEVIKSGVILIQEGKIAAIGSNIAVPAGAETIEASGWILYPGFIASSCRLSSGEIQNFESFSPDLSSLDGFDFFEDQSRLLAGGITAVYLDTSKNRLISGKGALVKLGTGSPGSSVLRKDVALRVNLGEGSLLPPMIKTYPAPISDENPITPVQKQFPSSSLGAYWVVRGLFRLEPYTGDLAKYMNNISSSLRQAREQKIPLLIQCQKVPEIEQALELSEQLKMPAIISGGAQAHNLSAVLKEKNIPVLAESNLKPNDSYKEKAFPLSEASLNDPENVSALISQGVLTSIAPAEDKYLPDLLWIVLYHQKYGLSAEELIKSITINPARIFGVEGRIGSLEKGKDADVLFFQSEKGKPLPQLKKVMIEGRIIYEQH